MPKVFFIVPRLILCLLVPVGLPALGGPDTDKLLQRFAGEFLALAPGKDKFPVSFMMGSDGALPAAERPAHKVTLSYGFDMAKYETTQELYQAIIGANPSRWKGPRNSVEMVSWNEALDFCKRVTIALRKLKLIGEDEVIRLPTEAEWEYACRAGTATKYSFGDDATKLGEYAWFTGNAKGNDPPVGVKKANPWGLYDMHGYVWEWCLDAWRDNYEKAPEDGSPVQGDKDAKRVIRGGAWTEEADACRSASRRGVAVDTRTAAIGFRCVRTKKVHE
jgi:formylglycine-generating enzyme required for sulfatase activity